MCSASLGERDRDTFDTGNSQEARLKSWNTWDVEFERDPLQAEKTAWGRENPAWKSQGHNLVLMLKKEKRESSSMLFNVVYVHSCYPSIDLSICKSLINDQLQKLWVAWDWSSFSPIW